MKFEKIYYGSDNEVLVQRTDNIREDFRIFLLKVLKREEFFKVKVQCI
jgi:hypothetical protein